LLKIFTLHKSFDGKYKTSINQLAYDFSVEAQILQIFTGSKHKKNTATLSSNFI